MGLVTLVNRRWDWIFTLVDGLVIELEGLMLGLVKTGGRTDARTG